MKKQLYKIMRYYFSDKKTADLIASDLTLEEAQAHCNDPGTAKTGVYFDGYTKQN